MMKEAEDLTYKGSGGVASRASIATVKPQQPPCKQHVCCTTAAAPEPSLLGAFQAQQAHQVGIVHVPGLHFQ